MGRQNRVDAVRAAVRTLLSEEDLPPAARLRAIREAKDLTQDELGDELEVSGPSVNDWELAKKCPAEDNARKLREWSLVALTAMQLPLHLALPMAWPRIQRGVPATPGGA